MSVDALLLDAGGILLLPDDERIATELAEIGIEVDRSLTTRAHYAGMRAVDLDPAPEVHWPAYTRAYVSELGVDSDVAAAVQAVRRAFVAMEWIVPIAAAIATLPGLAERATHLAIVSNSDGTVERLLRSFGVGDEMVCIIDSHVVGVAKPDPRIFELVLENIGVDADRAVHVGDSVRFDVVGARRAGVRALHLDPFGFCDSGDHEHVRELADVLDLL